MINKKIQILLILKIYFSNKTNNKYYLFNILDSNESKIHIASIIKIFI